MLLLLKLSIWLFLEYRGWVYSVVYFIGWIDYVMFFCGKIDNLSLMKKYFVFEKEEYSFKGGDVFFFFF